MTLTATPIPKPPKPETTRAFLVSAGLPKPTATVHHHYATELVTLPGPFYGQGWAFVYKCFVTGALRRWGLAPGPLDEPEPLPPPGSGSETTTTDASQVN